MQTTYRCTRCKRNDLPAEAFSPSQLALKGRWCRACQNESRRDKRAGRTPKRVTDVCLTCGKDIRHMRAHARWCSPACSAAGFRAANPGARRAYVLKCLYGMTLEEFDALLAKQHGVCAICQSVPPNGGQWNVDHDHATGATRGILCNPCNQGLGQFDDSPERLRRAAKYLVAHRS